MDDITIVRHDGTHEMPSPHFRNRDHRTRPVLMEFSQRIPIEEDPFERYLAFYKPPFVLVSIPIIGGKSTRDRQAFNNSIPYIFPSDQHVPEISPTDLRDLCRQVRKFRHRHFDLSRKGTEDWRDYELLMDRVFCGRYIQDHVRSKMVGTTSPQGEQAVHKDGVVYVAWAQTYWALENPWADQIAPIEDAHGESPALPGQAGQPPGDD
jgi:hypothetical protein